MKLNHVNPLIKKIIVKKEGRTLFRSPLHIRTPALQSGGWKDGRPLEGGCYRFLGMTWLHGVYAVGRRPFMAEQNAPRHKWHVSRQPEDCATAQYVFLQFHQFPGQTRAVFIP